ncbi:hypothetical protein VNO78_08888 [Psophocarpus tetragonolobus]|uniref:Uncharacterized protein n=1 Tax=Psophocarpus tetragonolobus TaxID=3891 RepID=A0AAN9SVV3_PSOTE
MGNVGEEWNLKKLDNVVDVLIGSHRNRYRRKFGFGRYVGIKNSRRLEEELDSVIIGNTKLYADLPLFTNGTFSIGLLQPTLTQDNLQCTNNVGRGGHQKKKEMLGSIIHER